MPYRDFRPVAERLPEDELPDTATGVYMELATERYFQQQFPPVDARRRAGPGWRSTSSGPLVGRRVGAYVVKKIEDDVLAKLPVVSRVYGSVKQVTDFFFAEKQIEYNSVVAVEYPREGVWSIGFVTGEGMRETVEAAGEPLYSILMPTSPDADDGVHDLRPAVEVPGTGPDRRAGLPVLPERAACWSPPSRPTAARTCR